jgi:hypothetical protein
LFTIFLARGGFFYVSGKKIMGLGCSLFISEIYKERWERGISREKKTEKGVMA